MPRRTVDLTPEQDDFIAAAVARGGYHDADEVLRAAVEGLRSRWTDAQASEDVLEAEIASGLASLERGAFTDVEDGDLDRYLDELAAAPRSVR